MSGKRGVFPPRSYRRLALRQPAPALHLVRTNESVHCLCEGSENCAHCAPEDSLNNQMTTKFTMKSTPPTIDVVTVSIQPITEDNCFVGPAITMRACDSAPNLGHLAVPGHQFNGPKDLASTKDACMLNSVSSVNSLITRDELALEKGYTTPSTAEGSPAHGCLGSFTSLFRRSPAPLDCADPNSQPEPSVESARSIALQIIFPFMVAGMGMVGAGLLLDTVQSWDVFVKVSEIMILVPALLGLKGNLEMTLASRLSTQAHLGTFDKKSDHLLLIAGNMALIELQAIVVGFLASWFAILMGLIKDGSFDVNHAFLVCASSILSASAASVILGLTMVGVVTASHKCNINPDNVATPIAASLGDVTSLALLAGIGTLLYDIIDKMVWVGPIIFGSFFLLIPILVILAKRNRYTSDALKNGWLPVISAMIISSIAGVILESAHSMYNNIAMFQPVINGVGGNLVAIHASRISTHLHTTAESGKLPPDHSKVCVNPCSTFFGRDVHINTARVLMCLVIPGHLVFAYVICYVKVQQASLTFSFVMVYLLVAVLQVAILLYLSLVWTHLMWRRKLDPDNCTIPYLTALGDFFGISLLTLGFLFLSKIGQEDIGIPEVFNS